VERDITVLLCLGIGEYSGVLSKGGCIRFASISLHELEMNFSLPKKQHGHHKIKNSLFLLREKQRIPTQLNTKK
jgi:hypothetical protein